ncbi:hypothetical protein PS2015_2399 [Pseudohongiella spirulinae]|uniref:PDZ domain-containing protein n=2 Tax=Pseudohongiella spirulinae TaxID=1249552 RepID=A0A0S2KFL5_9GAMM|nr:hypothetical protein PS2015_2399 [Pseudohongiella spirulinae]
MLVWAGHSLARVFWILFPSAETSVSGSLLSLPVSPTTARAVDLSTIRRAFILAPAGSGVLVDSSQQSSAADTRLDLVLRGSMVSNLPQRSQAIIASGAEQQVYQPGDRLSGIAADVELLAVYPDHVILMNAGREERLSMYEVRIERSQAANAIEATAITVASEVAESVPLATAALSNIIRLQVYQQDGRPVGLRIRHGSRADLLGNVGLRVGDLITAIDGQAVTQLTQLPGLLQTIEQSESVQLEVQRDDTRFDVNLNRAALGLQ